MPDFDEWLKFQNMTAEEQQRDLKRKALERKRQAGFFGEIFDPMAGPHADSARESVRKMTRSKLQEKRFGVPANIPIPLQGQETIPEQPIRDTLKIFLAKIRGRVESWVPVQKR